MAQRLIVPDLNCFVELPAVSGNAVFHLPDDAPGAVICSFPTNGQGGGGLELVSGSVNIGGADASGFQALFAFELQDSKGEPVHITDGRLSVSNCSASASCVY
jgi:hypothetical protein